MNVREVKTKHGDILGVPGDIHFDQHDPDALNLMIQVFYSVGVNRICLVGDTFESQGISRHGTPTRGFISGKGTIISEYEGAKPYIQLLYDSGIRGRYVLTGNHERWWAGVQDVFPGLLGKPWVEVYGDLFDGWHVFEEYTALKFGPLLVCHGHRLRGSLAKYSAATVLSNYPGQNTLYGHTHRIDSCITPTVKYGRSVVHGAWTCGHLKSREEEIKNQFVGPLSERHRQGFAIVYFKEVEGDLRFHVELVQIERDKRGRPFCIVQGNLFRV